MRTTSPISRHINRLLLDPNNYRFRDRSDYKPVNNDSIGDARIQTRTLNFLTGNNNENITDLIYSFTTNGVLQHEPIQVKAYGDDYVVVEGNRRTATLKILYDRFKSGGDVGRLTESDFKSITLIEHVSDDPLQELIAMGIHHISGKKKWNPINQSRLIRDLLENYNLEEEEVCKAIGITKNNLRRSMRTLSLIERYKDSDYGDQFETYKYSIFEEVTKNTYIKQWLDWNDALRRAENRQNEERLFAWISKEEVIRRNDDGSDEQTDVLDPIITKSHEIRELAKYINDKKAIDRMEASRSITEGYAYSDAIGVSRLHSAISNIKKEIDTSLVFAEYMVDDDYTSIGRLMRKMERLLPSYNNNISITEQNRSTYFSSPITSHFTSINILKYRKLLNVNIENLNSINIFVGSNNSGKTSVLETAYLLSKLNDLNSFLELERFRGKFSDGSFNAKWIAKNFISNIEIDAVFNNKEIKLQIDNQETSEVIEKLSYITTLRIDADVDGDLLESNVHLYDRKEPELYYQRVQALCQSAFSSPYRYNDKLLKKAHEYAVRYKKIDYIINFINENIDNNIEKIELVNIDNETRFSVSSKKLSSSIDITKYGEGLQRIFEIALMIVYCNNGILCIDEVDSAIHKSLLCRFTDFICKIANENNVQLFISTHNKECIDAFSNCENNKEITAFVLSDNIDGVTHKYIQGDELAKLVDSINIDIR